MEHHADLHTPLTSETLQARRPEAYRRLFAACETVVSVPLATGLAGERALHRRNANLLMQLPRRAWVGVGRTGSGEALATAEEYDVLRGDFVPVPAILRERITRALTPDSRSEEAFHVLLEGQDGRGLAVSGAVAAACALAAAIHRGHLPIASVDRWRDAPVLDTCADPAFQALVASARAGQESLRPGISVGGGIVNALLAAPVQLASFHADGCAVLLPEDFGAPALDASAWPVDVAVLATGTRNDLGLAPETALEDDRTVAFTALLRGMLPVRAPLGAPLRRSAVDAARRLQDQAFLETVRCWMQLWAHRGREHSTAALLDVIRRREGLLVATDTIHPAISHALSAVRTVSALRRTAAFPIQTGAHGGSILVVTPAGEARMRLLGLPRLLAQQGLEGACIEYASWRDAPVRRGPLVEQHLASGRRSVHVPDDACALVVHDRAGWHRAPIAQGSTDADVLVDAAAGKLRVAGRVVRSGEIPSQRATCEVLRLVLRSGGQLRSELLPRSWYRDARSEFVSKIASPLARVVKARTGADLVLRTAACEGGFEIALDAGGLRIGLVERISNLAVVHA